MQRSWGQALASLKECAGPGNCSTPGRLAVGEGGMQGHRVARAPGRRPLELPLRSDRDVDRGGGVGGSARRVDLELR